MCDWVKLVEIEQTFAANEKFHCWTGSFCETKQREVSDEWNLFRVSNPVWILLNVVNDIYQWMNVQWVRSIEPIDHRRLKHPFMILWNCKVNYTYIVIKLERGSMNKNGTENLLALYRKYLDSVGCASWIFRQIAFLIGKVKLRFPPENHLMPDNVEVMDL